MICALVSKTFDLAELEEDEILAISGVTLANSVLENVKGLGPQILPGILDLYLKQIQSVETGDFDVMLI